MGMMSSELPGDAPYNEYWVKVNGNTLPTLGIGHYYEFDTVNVSSTWLQTGQNTVEFHSNSQTQHGIEVCWPGAAITVRYAGAAYASPVAAAPSLVLPADNATNLPAPPTLVWNSALTATGYRLQISSNSSFTALVVDDSTITDTTKQVNGLTSQSTYYWRVRTLSVAGGSAFSASRSFSTVVASPTLVSPPNTASSVPVNARLSWMKIPGAAGYFVQVGTNQTFTSGVVYSDSTITDSTTIATGLAPPRRTIGGCERATAEREAILRCMELHDLRCPCPRTLASLAGEQCYRCGHYADPRLGKECGRCHVSSPGSDRFDVCHRHDPERFNDC